MTTERVCVVVAAEATIIRAPQHAYGENAASRDWVLFAQAWDPTQVEYV